MHRWLWWLPRDSADTGRYGRWRRWLRTARCDGGVARPLHAEDHSPPPRGRKRANAGTNRIRTRPSSSGLPYLASVGCRFAARSTIARSVDPLGREREAERRSRGSGLLVTPSRSTQRLHADRSAHVCPLCVRAIRRSTSTTCTGPPGIRGVYRCIAPNGLLRTGATALRGRDRLVLAIFEDR
jgi:hypothetical protein